VGENIILRVGGGGGGWFSDQYMEPLMLNKACDAPA
jgi:hypothetical protein